MLLMEYPIIYIHKWSHDYLETSIKQSSKNNKKIILIWDDNNLSIAKNYNIEHYYFDQYNISNFRKYYVHNKVSSNYQFELMCYERWFVLLEVMKRNNINRCLYLDSDILYFWNVDEEFKRIERYWNFELAYPNFSWHTTYIFSQNSLKNFCDFMMKCYTNEDMYKKLLNWPLIYQSWISDMSIFQLYKYNYPEKVFDLTKNYWDNIVYDWFINEPEWYNIIFWKKYFTLRNNKVYIYKDNKKLETKTLHFQMHMKSYMWLVFEKNIFLFRIVLFFNSVIEKLYFNFSFIRKLRKKWKDKDLFK